MGKKVLIALLSACWGFAVAVCIFNPRHVDSAPLVALCILMFLGGLFLVLADIWDK